MSALFEPRLWGKERGLTHPYPLGCHAIDAAVMAAALWDRYLTPRQRTVIADGWGLTEPEARSFVICLAGLHDLGKITPGFQGCAPGAGPLTGEPGYEPTPANVSSPSHQRATHLVLPELLHRLHRLPLNGRPTRGAAHQIGQLLGGHHGTYPIALSHQGSELTCPLASAPGLGEKAWDEQREHLMHLIYDLFGTPTWPTPPATGPAAAVTTGLVILADWLVSQLSWIRARQRRWDRDRTHDWHAHARRARRAAPKTLREAQLVPPTWQRTRSFRNLFPHLRGKTPHPLQTSLAQSLPALAKNGPGLLLITAPPGEGKTECALFAERIMGPSAGTKGLAFLLPTMATTDAMWARVRAHARANCRTPPPITLLHAMAWLDADYTPDQLATATSSPDIVAEWLRGRHRGFLAGIAVGTWDQAALAVLPHRFMALRWLGLSGKTVIIDEVHAYDAHGHALTLRLLEWLGALGVPVVLLSATVTGDTAAALIHAYRRGAGHHDTPPITPSYPGWTYTDHTTGTITTSPTLGSNRAHPLNIDTITCTHTHNPDRARGRARAVLNLLAPLEQAHKGCALIICNTVADAQATRDLLDTTWATSTDRPLVRILHARMPARQRAAITRRLQRWTGPNGKRPNRPFVVITTQVAEQSLDVDFDLVVSDLAPLALLLQRAGRGHRHPRTDRPTWANTPRLAVLIPAGQLPPPAWGDVYPASLLRRTRDLLTTLDGEPVNVPQDVQRLVDQVYGPEFAGADDTARLADDTQRAATARLTAIPAPAAVRDLHPLTNTDEHPDQIATRLGAESVRILPTYLTPDGNHWLHPTHYTPRTALPQHIDPNDRHTIRQLMQATIPINSQWLTSRDPTTHTPDNWSHIPGLRDLILLPHPVTRTAINPYRAAGRAISLDPQNGLVRH
ncbi:CRISPR-associated helicase Cas3' [Streptomyces sp. NBC_00704]|uniref:CRISPR-associated helicase Cas3' n=1 Tax=Streptomyces sp. NBC_00704 TaxID=2975809 RepID=UPI002E369555|nr:CRISPR-associated helicase Cas3' [Streptomyces sp. NBC_00704]